MTGSRLGHGGAAQETRWAVPWIKAVIDWGRWLRGDASPFRSSGWLCIIMWMVDCRRQTERTARDRRTPSKAVEGWLVRQPGSDSRLAHCSAF